MNRSLIFAFVTCFFFVCMGQFAWANAFIRIHQDQSVDVEIATESRNGSDCIVVRNLAQPEQAKIKVRRSDSKSDAPGILGTSEVVESILIFKPRFPLVPAQYVIEVQTNDDAKPMLLDLAITSEDDAATKVNSVFPSADELPENTLKFYVHFSAPMQKGDIYEFIRLKEFNGKEIELPFLEIEQEFWSRDSKRLTLLLDPGRIKRGLKPREEMGPILVSGKTYELIIDGQWPDANGNKLGSEFVKRFRASDEDHSQPDPKTWKLKAPLLDSKTELIIDFPGALDHAMLMHVINVVDSDGNHVSGMAAVSNHEKRWSFVPRENWRAGNYRIKVSENLEDNAGNSIGRSFDVDLFDETQAPTESTTELVFEIGQSNGR